MLVVQKDTTLSLSSQVQELLSETERLNESFKHSMAGSEPCKIMQDLRIAKGLVFGLNLQEQ
jgi:hypothetical protein